MQYNDYRFTINYNGKSITKISKSEMGAEKKRSKTIKEYLKKKEHFTIGNVHNFTYQIKSEM